MPSNSKTNDPIQAAVEQALKSAGLQKAAEIEPLREAIASAVNGALAVSPKADPAVQSVADFCAELGIGRTLAYAEAKAGRLQILKLGRRSLITADAKRRFLASLPSLHGEAA